MDGTIEINGLRIFARHGVMEQERAVGNMFEVTVHLRYPMDAALCHDSLDGTLNYAEGVALIKEEMDKPSALLEHVGYRIKKSFETHYPLIKGGSIRLAKLTPPISCELDSVAVKIEW